MTLGNRIKEIRTDNKMIQKEFAEGFQEIKKEVDFICLQF